jgi:hypothetical protein
MKLLLSPADVTEYAWVIAKNTLVFSISHAEIRALVLRYPYLRWLYWPARALASFLRRRSFPSAQPSAVQSQRLSPPGHGQ